MIIYANLCHFPIPQCITNRHNIILGVHPETRQATGRLDGVFWFFFLLRHFLACCTLLFSCLASAVSCYYRSHARVAGCDSGVAAGSQGFLQVLHCSCCSLHSRYLASAVSYRCQACAHVACHDSEVAVWFQSFLAASVRSFWLVSGFRIIACSFERLLNLQGDSEVAHAVRAWSSTRMWGKALC